MKGRRGPLNRVVYGKMTATYIATVSIIQSQSILRGQEWDTTNWEYWIGDVPYSGRSSASAWNSICKENIPWKREFVVSIGYVRYERPVIFLAQGRFLFSPKRPDQFWDSPSVLFNACWKLPSRRSDQILDVTTHQHVVPMLNSLQT